MAFPLFTNAPWSLLPQGEDYSYNVKVQFKETEGTGTRDEGLGVIGRPCTFEFSKQQSTSPLGGH